MKFRPGQCYCGPETGLSPSTCRSVAVDLWAYQAEVERSRVSAHEFGFRNKCCAKSDDRTRL